MVFAIEPMVNAEGPRRCSLDDGWSVITADGSLSAHFEHTIAVTDDGPEVFTAPEPPWLRRGREQVDLQQDPLGDAVVVSDGPDVA